MKVGFNVWGRIGGYWMVLGMVLMGFNIPVSGHSLKPVSFQTIVDKSGVIVHGIVERIESGTDPHSGLVCTWTTVKVVEYLKGDNPGETVIFKQYGGTDKQRGITWSSNVPSLTPGQEILFCYYPKSAIGLTSPIGESQGIFYIKRDSSGRNATLDNGMPPSVLFPQEMGDSADSSSMKIQSIGKNNVRILNECKSLQLDAVKRAIRNYVSQPVRTLKTMNVERQKFFDKKNAIKMARE